MLCTAAKTIGAGMPLFLLLQQAGKRGLLQRGLSADGCKTKGLSSLVVRGIKLRCEVIEILHQTRST